MKSNWIQLTTKQYRRKGFKNLRRHFGTCTYCGRKRKFMTEHFEKYHPEVLREIDNALGKGEVGMINGMRVMRTSYLR